MRGAAPGEIEGHPAAGGHAPPLHVADWLHGHGRREAYGFLDVHEANQLRGPQEVHQQCCWVLKEMVE